MSSSAESENDTIIMFCASCGIGEGDGIKLKKCTACHLVRYCSVKCQKNHRPTHKKECKKRAAELKDEILFKLPESSNMGDCPICCLPLSIDKSKSGLYTCCSKIVCQGCNRVNQKREEEGRLQKKCPFCRKISPDTYEEQIERLMKRIEANDPVSLWKMGTIRCKEGDYKGAFEYHSRAAALGNVEAHFELSLLYKDGQGVEKDEKRELHHTEQAAIGGHPSARHNLGYFEGRTGRMDRAVKHFIMAAKLGRDDSLETVKRLYKNGYASNEDFAAALRGHHAAIEATKSPQREEAYEFYESVAKKSRSRAA